MDIVSIKQLAEQQNVSYEAIRKQIVRYSEELKGHIIRKNRTQYLDEWAVKFLKEKRRESPIILMHMDQNEMIEDLKANNEHLTKQLLEAQARIIAMQDMRNEMIEAKIKYDLLLENHNQTKEELNAVKTELDQTKDDLADVSTKLKLAEMDKDIAEKEAQSYHRSWFGFYRKD